MQFVEAPNNFYLGARVDPESDQVLEDEVIYYDSRDLMTHGVILGMTGSGKTGLGITILEEAVIDNIPLLIIDPKGDITNMLLAFPDLEPSRFQPWVNPDDAVRADATVEEHARVTAERWKEGLEKWGITNARIQDYRRASRFSIYTPGSEAGLPISILHSFAAPAGGWTGNEEILRERISGTVTAMLALIGMNANPVEDREHILISNIFEYNWRHNTDLSLEQLIVQVQRPPFGKLGVLDVETVFPEKDRFKLAQQLNNIIAAPNFQSWLQGEPIDIPSLLYTPEGYPRTSIFYIAHLNEAERQFIITLLLENLLAWMRTLSGSTSLRALIYIDEVFGMMPPYPRNPVTKDPIMRLLKQARAFGVGALLSTQNPKDIDYKGLSNIGTWFIGKLQTENDKERVLEGLDSARDASSVLDLKTVDKLIGRLGSRQFIYHNVHETETPKLMTTRWAMSYLSGPLTRDQISLLMANQRQILSQQQAAQPQQLAHHYAPVAGVSVGAPISQAQPQSPSLGQSSTPLPPTYSDTSGQKPISPKREEKEDVPAGFSAIPPALPSSIYQYYLPTEYSVEQSIRNWESWWQQPAINVETRRRLLYRPALLAQTTIRVSHNPTNSIEMLTYAFVVPTLPRTPFIAWEDYLSDPFDPHSLDPDPFADAFYAEIPSTLSSGTGFKQLQTNLTDWLYQNVALSVYYNPVLKMYSGLGESKRDFYARLQAVARQQRDEEIDKIAERYDKKLVALEDRARQKAIRLDAEREELTARQREEMISAGESLMQMFKGRGTYHALSRATRLRRYTSQSQDQMGLKEQDYQTIINQMDQTSYEMEQTLQAVQEKWAEAVQKIEEVTVTPYKKDIHMMLFGIGWVPYWDSVINGAQTILPASSSGLTQAQTQL